ncbi:hypothetical protein [Paraflavitalea speifideaquila]|uniref:hypothetical protein n=1 Tax=Paraflavitalea speifideaquila TaxID=3076558 RepID=UPI0028E6991A|nr:hypothetical protein [Paraflavitalea speifideiaquila]
MIDFYPFLLTWLLLTGISLQVFNNCAAQSVPADTGFTAFSDLHIHTSLKKYYHYVEAPDSILLHVNDPVFLRNKNGRMGWLSYDKKPKARHKGDESNMVNYDQANYSNLAGLAGSVLCLSITPPEKVFVVTGTDRWLNKNLVTHISLKRQEAIAEAHNPLQRIYGSIPVCDAPGFGDEQYQNTPGKKQCRSPPYHTGRRHWPCHDDRRRTCLTRPCRRGRRKKRAPERLRQRLPGGSAQQHPATTPTTPQVRQGTDFDGFIHPIALCPTANDIPLFHK